MRLFIAAPLPVPVLRAIQNYQSQYDFPGVRPVPETNLHLTLLFLGETPEESLPIIGQKLEEILVTHPKFNLSLKEISPGPKLKSPRLIWIRFEENPAFEKLVKALSKALPEAGNTHPELIPHVTVARIKKDILSGIELPVIKPTEFPVYEVDKIALWQSELGSPHPHYSVLKEFSFAPNPA
jgi:RNA 2',3'-cyclic 3'-phosphodiesterase